MNGLYVAPPHGELSFSGAKTALAKARPRDLDGVSRVLCSGQLAYGELTLGKSEEVGVEEFDSRFEEHRVTRSERKRWWPEAEKLYLFPFEDWKPFESPRGVAVPPRVQTIMGEVKWAAGQEGEKMSEKAQYEFHFHNEATPEAARAASVIEVDELEKARGEGQGVGGPRQGDGGATTCVCPKCGATSTHDKGTPCTEQTCPKCGASMVGQDDKEVVEGGKPWTSANPPAVAKNWTDEEKTKCVKAANGVLRGGGSETDAIRACIKNAGKTKHPGGKELAEDLRSEDEKDLSFDDIRDAAVNSFEKAEEVAPPVETSYISRLKVYAGHVEFERGDMFYKASYKINKKDNTVEWGDLVEMVLTPKGEKSVEETTKKEKTWREGITGALASFADNLRNLASSPTLLLDAETGIKTIKHAETGETLLLTWTMNAFKDKENETFTTKSIEEYAQRAWGEIQAEGSKGRFDFWHIPGSEFGDIKFAGSVGRYLFEFGTFDDDSIGQGFRQLFEGHPDGHPDIAPEGWATSHKYKYIKPDREDKIYEWFDKDRTTVLPRSHAANPWNPSVEVIPMLSDEQKSALATALGEDLAQQIVDKGESLTKKLEEEGVDHKSTDDAEKDKGGDTDGKPAEVKELDVTALAVELAKEFQLENLDKQLTGMGEAIEQVQKDVSSFGKRFEALEKSDVEKLAEKEKHTPQFGWHIPSRDEGNVVREGDALKGKKPETPKAITSIIENMRRGG